MFNQKVTFEKVGDISKKYSFLEIYLPQYKNPIIGASISDEKVLSITIYKNDFEFELSIIQWELILSKVKIFFEEEISNEDSFEKFIDLEG